MGSNPTLSVLYVERLGEVLEWPNRRDWKSRVPSQGDPWVRIPPSPPGLFAVVDKFGILNKRHHIIRTKAICYW